MKEKKVFFGFEMKEGVVEPSLRFGTKLFVHLKIMGQTLSELWLNWNASKRMT